MKRLVNIILVLVLFIQSFIWVIPVEALEGDPELQINGVKQGDKYLEQEDGVYLVDGYDSIYLDYTVLNDNGERLFIRSIDAQGNGGYFEHYGNENSLIALNVGTDKENYNFTVQLCNDRNCNEIYDSKTINLKVTYFNEVKDSKIYFTNVKQGDKDILISESNQLMINNKENISLTLKGENLIDDALYRVENATYDERLEFLGSELEKGVNVTYKMNGKTYFRLSAYLGEFYNNLSIEYLEGDVLYSYANFVLCEDDTIPLYDYQLVYTDYLEEQMAYGEMAGNKYLVVSSKYHNEEHTLSYYLKGDKYLDQDYDVTVKVRKGDEILYTKQDKINGLLLNEGTYIELDDLVLKVNTDEYFYDALIYDFDICIDFVENSFEVKYNSIGKDAYLGTDVFFENGLKNLSSFAGDGNHYFESLVYETNKDVFNKYSSIYLNFMGKDFNDDEEYEYVLIYGNSIDYVYDEYEVIDEGTIKGDILNHVGLLFEVDNRNNYSDPSYQLIVKKGEEIIYTGGAVLNLVSSPTLANARLTADNKNIYLLEADYEFNYIATRNAPIDIKISGIGFDEDQDYVFDFGYSFIIDGESQYESGGKVTFSGKELNDGTASILFEKDITEEVDSLRFGLYCDIKEALEENVAIQGGFDVTFVDSKDLFQDTEQYVVDNLDDLIKNIKKNTSVDDFVSSLNIVNNGKVKIYDATGTKEVEGNVGTGMLARVMNEYEQSILDMDIVVKGDVSGDGNISVTDLVKVKRHLAKVQELDGVYEIAGNVTETGSVGITDLVKISRDVAKIEEVE